METIISELSDLRTGLLILVNAGVILRVIACVIQGSGNFDERGIYFKRAKHAVIFAVIANALIAFKDLISTYYPM